MRIRVYPISAFSMVTTLAAAMTPSAVIPRNLVKIFVHPPTIVPIRLESKPFAVPSVNGINFERNFNALMRG